MSPSVHPTILRLRQQLTIPRIHETAPLPPQWPSQAEHALSQLDHLLSQSDLTLSAEDDVQIVIACAPFAFVHEQPWSSQNARWSADSMFRCCLCSPPNLTLTPRRDPPPLHEATRGARPGHSH